MYDQGQVALLHTDAGGVSLYTVPLFSMSTTGVRAVEAPIGAHHQTRGIGAVAAGENMKACKAPRTSRVSSSSNTSPNPQRIALRRAIEISPAVHDEVGAGS